MNLPKGMQAGLRDGRLPHDQLARHETGRLAGSHPIGGLVQFEVELRVAASAHVGHGAGQGLRVVAKLDAVDLPPRPVQGRGAYAHRCPGQLLALPHDHTVGGCVRGQDVERLRAADAQPTTLADGEVVMAHVLAEAAAAAVHNVAASLANPAVAREERTLSLAGEETEV